MIKWVYGNTLPLIVPLETVVKTENGETREDYIPPVGSIIEVWAVGEYKKKKYDYTLDGNKISFVDDGTLGVGKYGIAITVLEPESRRLRSFKCGELQIVKCTEALELGEFVGEGAIVLDAATYFWAKGDKGDKGEKGDAGTTDYNELENKPDLSVYLENVSEEEFEQIFS